jgi:hypothetical protein
MRSFLLGPTYKPLRSSAPAGILAQLPAAFRRLEPFHRRIFR